MKGFNTGEETTEVGDGYGKVRLGDITDDSGNIVMSAVEKSSKKICGSANPKY